MALFNCLKWCFVCVVFENVLKKMPCLGNLCNDSCLNIYKGVLSFENIFQCFKSLIVLWSVFENSKDVLQVLIK